MTKFGLIEATPAGKITRKMETCPQGHKLAPGVNFYSSCSRCRVRLLHLKTFSCRLCGYDLCRYCSDMGVLRPMPIRPRCGYRLNVGVVAHAKNHMNDNYPMTTKTISLTSKLDDRRQCGDDSFVNISSRDFFAMHDVACLSVLDGVGGWRGRIPDAGLVSHLLSEQIAREFEANPNHYAQLQGTALSLLQRAYTNLKETADQELGGSTTACVALLKVHEDLLELEVANLGDSGLFVVREGEIVFKSPVSLGLDGCTPHQLAFVPKRIFEPDYVMSHPRHAARTRFVLQDGDWVFIASDGVFDNVDKPELKPAVGFDEEFSDFHWMASRIGRYEFSNILNMLADDPDPQDVALRLVEGCAQDDAPKPDDTTVIVLHIESSNPTFIFT